MRGLDEALQWVQLAEWIVLAAAALNVWRTRRDRTSTWLALTFGSLALVVIVGRVLPQQEGMVQLNWPVKLLLVVLVLFPYFLYRFMVSLVPHTPGVWAVVHVLTGATVVATLALPSLPGEGDPRPGWFWAFLVVFLVQWVFTLGRVALRLWRAGRGQPTVARRRMRTMSLGSAALALTLVISATSPQADEPTATQLVTSFMSLLAGPFFLFGFAPPAALRAQWRRRDEAALREVEVGLVTALGRDEIADAMLPQIVGLVGASGAMLLDRDGGVLGTTGTPGADAEALRGVPGGDGEHYEPILIGSSWLLPMENGSLIVTTGPLTPFFGTDELRSLSATAVLVDLALGRARLFELERRSREAMQDFVAIASHDLRTPVSVIHGAAVMLGDHWQNIDDDEKHNFVSAIRRQVVLLDRLIDDLLTVSKLDVEEIDVIRESVDVTEIAREAVEAVVRDGPVDISTDGPTLAVADPDHVTRMLQNYLNNALVYGAPPYRIEISGRDDWVTVRVIDHGSGVSEDFAPLLFQKFARADKKKSKSTQGTGLGLSIVRGLAQANGGDAWYEETSSGGACFALRLPSVGGESQVDG